MTSCSLSARSSWPKRFRNTSTSHSPTSRGVPMPTSFILRLPSSQLCTESRSWLNEKNLIIREGEVPSFSWIAYMLMKGRREKTLTSHGKHVSTSEILTDCSSASSYLKLSFGGCCPSSVMSSAYNLSANVRHTRTGTFSICSLSSHFLADSVWTFLQQ